MNILGIFKKQQQPNPIPNPKKCFADVRCFLESINNINYGGCGISALALYDAAVKENLNPKIVYCYNWEYNKRINDNFKKGKEKHGASCTHVVLKIKDKYWDSDGENNSIIMEYEKHNIDETITRNHLVDSIIHGSWNPCFDRGKWLPKIEEFIGYKLI